MQTKQFGQGEVIFREGALGNTMYEIHSGTVGIFIDYGEDGEKKLTELDAGRIFGEMAVIEIFPRSATAVALEKTQLTEITEDRLADLFREKPAKVLTIMQHLSNRLRKLTRDYRDACRTAAEIGMLDGTDEEAAAGVKAHAERCAAQASGYDALL